MHWAWWVGVPEPRREERNGKIPRVTYMYMQISATEQRNSEGKSGLDSFIYLGMSEAAVGRRDGHGYRLPAGVAVLSID